VLWAGGGAGRDGCCGVVTGRPSSAGSRKRAFDFPKENRSFNDFAFTFGQKKKSMMTSSRYSTRLREANEVVDFGRCGDAEKIDSPASVGAKVAALAGLIKSARRVVVHTGAGISTAAGIPDFRGPDGDWTRLMRRQPPLPCAVDAGPTQAHLALTELVRRGLVHHVVTQNVDGLHEKSGLPRDCLSEIHGSCFGHYCYECGTLYPTWDEVDGFGCQPVVPPLRCARLGCGQLLHDRVKSWASILPLAEMKRAEAGTYFLQLLTGARGVTC
jgi:Sir2 family